MKTKKNKRKPKPLTLSRVEHWLMRHTDEVSPWRIFKIMTEFVTGFEFLKRYGKAATFFGTARCTSRDRTYQQASRLAYKLSKKRFAIITGGGPGIMEAANKGAYDAGGQSVGINIKLPHEQRTNGYVKESESFNYFFTRKVMLAFASEVYIFFPGGFGTLDEFFEITTLVQTGKINHIPIVLVGRKYWRPLLTWIEETMLDSYQAIDKKDVKLYHLVDSADEAYAVIMKLVKGDNKYHLS